MVISVCILQVTEQIMDEKLGRMVTRVVLPRVVMHSRHHYGVLLTFCYAEFCGFRLLKKHNEKIKQIVDDSLIDRHSQKILQA